MKTYYNLKLLLIVLFLGFVTNAQSFKLDKEASTLEIDGTSNIHDWTMTAENSNGTLTAEFENGTLKDIEKLEFKVISESLMSGKSGMDKNTYKALNTDKHKAITFSLKEVKSIDEVSTDNYKVKATGTLEIAGTKKPITLNFNLNAKNNLIIINGQHKLNMTNYGVEAPTAMFGTIKTGEEIVVKFESNFTK